jgi:hypothetical protein
VRSTPPTADVTVVPNDWLPASAINLTLTSGQAAATLDNPNHAIKTGDWLFAAQGLSARTRVVSKTGANVVLSKPATASGTQSIWCSRLS